MQDTPITGSDDRIRGDINPAVMVCHMLMICSSLANNQHLCETLETRDANLRFYVPHIYSYIFVLYTLQEPICSFNISWNNTRLHF